jgi:hypothetical protein
MVIGALTAPAGNKTVRPVAGIEIVPPAWSIVFETLITSLWFFLHQTARSSRPVATTFDPLLDAAEVGVPTWVAAASVKTGGAVTLGSEHDAIRNAPSATRSERDGMERSIDRLVSGVDEKDGHPKATAMPERKLLVGKDLQ